MTDSIFAAVDPVPRDTLRCVSNISTVQTLVLIILPDAVYHTSLVFGGIEYFFGQGVQTCYPGTTHHGAPMEIIPMGETSLPIEIILEYLDSLKQIYTPEVGIKNPL